jgi:peptidoglycan/LPS O-acetylase OafA/YrhL
MRCLDGVRGGLAFYVLLSHALPFAPLPAWVLWLFQHGGAAVDVFFILSGLVIVLSLESFNYRARPFLIARVARIYPVFLVVFVLSLMVQPLDTGFERMPWLGPDSPAHFIWSGGWPKNWGIGIITHLTMTHGLFPNSVLPDVWVGFLGAAWSLSTEWQFYLFALLIGARLGLMRMAWLFLALSLAAFVWQIAAPDAWQFSRAFLPNKAQYFALGIVSASVIRGDRRSLRPYLAVLTVTLVISALEGGIDKLLPPVVWTACLAAQLMVSSPRTAESRHWVPVFVSMMLGWLASILQSKPMVWLGAVSYCIYLINEPVQKLIGVGLAFLTEGHATLFIATWIPGSVVLPIIAAWWLHDWIELPAQRYGHGVALAAVNVQ